MLLGFCLSPCVGYYECQCSLSKVGSALWMMQSGTIYDLFREEHGIMYLYTPPDHSTYDIYLLCQ